MLCNLFTSALALAAAWRIAEQLGGYMAEWILSTAEPDSLELEPAAAEPQTRRHRGLKSTCSSCQYNHESGGDAFLLQILIARAAVQEIETLLGEFDSLRLVEREGDADSELPMMGIEEMERGSLSTSGGAGKEKTRIGRGKDGLVLRRAADMQQDSKHQGEN